MYKLWLYPSPFYCRGLNFSYFYANFSSMKRVVLMISFSFFSSGLWAQNLVNPEGSKLLWVLLFVLVFLISPFLFRYFKHKNNAGGKKSFFSARKVNISLVKDRIYYPDFLTLEVINNGSVDIDLDKPLLVFDNFWLKRKFRLKGINGYSFYPLYLEKGKKHELNIDLQHFYAHDKRLRKYPKVNIHLNDVRGKKLGRRSVFLRKTLIKF